MDSCRNAISLQDQLVAALPQAQQRLRDGSMAQQANMVQAGAKPFKQGRQVLITSCLQCALHLRVAPVAQTSEGRTP
jgi:hypothetical protein